jgi:hypothetical protein
VPVNTGDSVGLLNDTGQAGTGIDIHFASYARCILADAAINLIRYSDDITQSAWTKLACSATYGHAAPNGTSTASRIIENSANDAHLAYEVLTVSSAAADYSYSVAVKAGPRTWAFVRITNTTTGDARCYVNLTSGALGTVSVTGTGFAYPRAYVANLGDGWFLVTITARKTDAATTLAGAVGPAFGNDTVIYTGDGSSYIAAWRSTLSASSVGTRLVLTTGTAVTSASQTGSGIYVKGLPASTNGLLLPGDWIEINQQLKMVTASLDSDAAGLGYLQFRPRLHRPVADNDPIIVTKPMGKFLLRDGAQWNNRYGLYMDIDLTLDEVYE